MSTLELEVIRVIEASGPMQTHVGPEMLQMLDYRINREKDNFIDFFASRFNQKDPMYDNIAKVISQAPLSLCLTSSSKFIREARTYLDALPTKELEEQPKQFPWSRT